MGNLVEMSQEFRGRIEDIDAAADAYDDELVQWTAISHSPVVFDDDVTSGDHWVRTSSFTASRARNQNVVASVQTELAHGAVLYRYHVVGDRNWHFFVRRHQVADVCSANQAHITEFNARAWTMSFATARALVALESSGTSADWCRSGTEFSPTQVVEANRNLSPAGQISFFTPYDRRESNSYDSFDALLTTVQGQLENLNHRTSQQETVLADVNRLRREITIIRWQNRAVYAAYGVGGAFLFLIGQTIWTRVFGHGPNPPPPPNNPPFVDPRGGPFRSGGNDGPPSTQRVMSDFGAFLATQPDTFASPTEPVGSRISTEHVVQSPLTARGMTAPVTLTGPSLAPFSLPSGAMGMVPAVR